MSEDPAALTSISSTLPAQGDYDAICSALMRSERGRWFLQEYARRNRSADTQILLGAIERIESVIRVERGEQARQNLRSDLLEMATAITRTQAEVSGIKPRDAEDSARPETELAAQGSEADHILASAERVRD